MAATTRQVARVPILAFVRLARMRLKLSDAAARHTFSTPSRLGPAAVRIRATGERLLACAACTVASRAHIMAAVSFLERFVITREIIIGRVRRASEPSFVAVVSARESTFAAVTGVRRSSGPRFATRVRLIGRVRRASEPAFASRTGFIAAVSVVSTREPAFASRASFSAADSVVSISRPRFATRARLIGGVRRASEPAFASRATLDVRVCRTSGARAARVSFRVRGVGEPSLVAQLSLVVVRIRATGESSLAACSAIILRISAASERVPPFAGQLSPALGSVHSARDRRSAFALQLRLAALSGAMGSGDIGSTRRFSRRTVLTARELSHQTSCRHKPQLISQLAMLFFV